MYHNDPCTSLRLAAARATHRGPENKAVFYVSEAILEKRLLWELISLKRPFIGIEWLLASPPSAWIPLHLGSYLQ